MFMTESHNVTVKKVYTHFYTTVNTKHSTMFLSSVLSLVQINGTPSKEAVQRPQSVQVILKKASCLLRWFPWLQQQGWVQCVSRCSPSQGVWAWWGKGCFLTWSTLRVRDKQTPGTPSSVANLPLGLRRRGNKEDMYAANMFANINNHCAQSTTLDFNSRPPSNSLAWENRCETTELKMYDDISAPSHLYDASGGGLPTFFFAQLS